MEHILPSEIATKICLFNRHPVAEFMVESFKDHDSKMIQYRKFYNEKGKPTPSESYAKHHFLQTNGRQGYSGQTGKLFRQLYYES